MRFLMTIALVMSLASGERLNGQQSAAPAVPMTLDVDATDAPMKILLATLTMPARPGAMTLFYPKWIPGEHMPSGPIANLTGLHVFADGADNLLANLAILEEKQRGYASNVEAG